MNTTTLRAILVLLTGVAFAPALNAQDFVWVPSTENVLPFVPDTTRTDSLPPLPKPRLLPSNISWAERDLWDTNGFFRNIGLASTLTPESRRSELDARRTMLTAHQIGGFVTLGCMITAVWYGQNSLNHPDVKEYRNYHQTFVTATIITYSATGLLAVLSPPPMIRRDEVSTTTIHKTLAWVHFAGMVLTPILGSYLHRNHQMSYDQLAHFHQVSAYVTTAALAASMIVITF